MKVGDGSRVSAWYDIWNDVGPLSSFLTPRTISNAGFRLDAKVKDIHENGSWIWPTAWRDTYPVLIQLDHFTLNPDMRDEMYWKDGSELLQYSSSNVCHSIRVREPDVNWVKIVWFHQCIPKHAFLMWLIVRRKLLTQDIILQWDSSRRKNMNMMCCVLCFAHIDSHNHLFFECKYSSHVWDNVRHKAGMSDVKASWGDIMDWLLVRVRSKTAATFVSKLLVATVAYFIWQERNARLFRNQTRPPDTICGLIVETMRFKLMGVKFKDCVRTRRLLEDWGIGGANVIDDGG
ncbi:uncharacterized protein LOC110933311 [Helianthus annuus]|uniref:uncharacterized protein LOC110933311 n=1 Tax=Helianthus annuus TaxID=4232 RepID=UPI000B8F31BD|nr:uncharacterized protein LOC110933311 [Helianthus annuus]